MTRIGILARDALALAAPYWRSEERWRARLLLAIVIGLNLALVAVTVELTYWQRAFFNALEARDWSAFIALLFWWRQTADGWVPSFALIAAAFVPLTMYELYLRQALQIRWRRWLTDAHVDRWLKDRTYYRLVLADEGVDNPDQRIAEDIRLFVNDTLNLGLGLMRAVVALLSFIIVLWTMSEPVTVGGITVHGYLVWAALLFSVAGTVLTHLVGRRLIDLTYIEQKAEADFRFGLTRLRENAESVAFHEGEQDEKRQSVNRFTAIATNWLGIMRVTRRLMFVTTSFGQLALVFPFAVVAPAYFAGRMPLGEVFQISNAFVQVQGALSWFVTNYAPVTGWCAIVERLAHFGRAMSAARARADGPRVEAGTADTYEVRDLRLSLPDGRDLLHANALSIVPGAQTLIEGSSGSGKTTLLRAIAGLWPFGSGAVHKPPGRSLFLPQRAYVPLGSFKHAVTYPLAVEAVSDAEALAALSDAGLAHLAPLLHVVDAWERRLSGGEQQRLALARALLYKPDWLFLDEATSALDPANQKRFHEVLRSRLPGTTIVAIAHHVTRDSVYDCILEVATGSARLRQA